MADQKPESTGKIVEALFDLTYDRDLADIERIVSRPDKYKILIDEPVTVPMRHLRYERL
jgi:hypothetical protein